MRTQKPTVEPRSAGKKLRPKCNFCRNFRHLQRNIATENRVNTRRRYNWVVRVFVHHARSTCTRIWWNAMILRWLSLGTRPCMSSLTHQKEMWIYKYIGSKVRLLAGAYDGRLRQHRVHDAKISDLSKCFSGCATPRWCSRYSRITSDIREGISS